MQFVKILYSSYMSPIKPSVLLTSKKKKKNFILKKNVYYYLKFLVQILVLGNGMQLITVIIKTGLKPKKTG